MHLVIAEAGARGERRVRTSRDEVDLIHRVADKDGTAFDLLYRAYCPRLRRFIGRVTRRPQIVDEIVNDTMLVVWRKASTYNLRSNVSTWIFGIAFRRALKSLKAIDNAVEFDPDQCTASSSLGPEGMLLQQETRAWLAHALNALSHDHRTVLELTYFEGHSCAEIAEMMRCPVSTVKTRMFHARRRLRSLIASDVAIRLGRGTV